MKITVISGSLHDKAEIEPVLNEFRNVPIELTYFVASAHRSHQKLTALIKQLEQDDTDVIVAVAGHSAHLAGVIAAQTLIPVYGVPLASSDLKGVDALYSMVMMPGGVPVATFALGKAGLKNAILMACAHAARSDQKLKTWLQDYRKQMADDIPGTQPVWRMKK